MLNHIKEGKKTNWEERHVQFAEIMLSICDSDKTDQAGIFPRRPFASSNTDLTSKYRTEANWWRREPIDISRFYPSPNSTRHCSSIVKRAPSVEFNSIDLLASGAFSKHCHWLRHKLQTDKYNSITPTDEIQTWLLLQILFGCILTRESDETSRKPSGPLQILVMHHPDKCCYFSSRHHVINLN